MAAKDAETDGGASALPPFFQVGEIRSSRESDYDYFLHLCDNDEGWDLKQGDEKGGPRIWNRDMGKTGVKMLKVRGELVDVSGDAAFDVLMDGPYRKTWDDVMIQDEDVCRVDDNNDIGYYVLKMPPGMKSRDFVKQRTFRARPGEWMTFNHSVTYEPIPPKKEYIRGCTYINGYLVRSTGGRCIVTFLTHGDPRGWIPKWVLNLVVTKVAPTIFEKLNAAIKKYDEWKAQNSPEYKPWLHPEQNTLPLIDPKLVQQSSSGVQLGEEEKAEGLEDREEIPEDVLKALQEQSGEDSGNQEQSGEDSGKQEQSGEDSGNQEQSGEDSGKQEQSGEDSGKQEQSGEDSGKQEQSGEDSGDQEQTGEDSGKQAQTGEDSGKQEQSGEDSGKQEQSGEDSGKQEQSGDDSGKQEQSGEDSGEQEQSGEDSGKQEQSGEDSGEQEQTGDTA